MIGYRVVKQVDLKAFREEMGATCELMALLVGCSPPMVNMVENGRKNHGETTQQAFGRVFGVVIEWTKHPLYKRDQRRERANKKAGE